MVTSVLKAVKLLPPLTVPLLVRVALLPPSALTMALPSTLTVPLLVMVALLPVPQRWLRRGRRSCRRWWRWHCCRCRWRWPTCCRVGDRAVVGGGGGGAVAQRVGVAAVAGDGGGVVVAAVRRWPGCRRR